MKNVEKISVSKEKRRIYVGGKGFAIFESKGDANQNPPEYELKPLDARLKSTLV
mgnify:CR=1 FL=1